MKCWKLKTTYCSGRTDIDYFNSLKMALVMANCRHIMLNAKCSLMFANWR